MYRIINQFLTKQITYNKKQYVLKLDVGKTYFENNTFLIFQNVETTFPILYLTQI